MWVDKRASAGTTNSMVAPLVNESKEEARASSSASKESHQSIPSTLPPTSAPTPTPPPASTHLTGVRLYLLIVAACLSAYLVGLDQTIITTAIPKITDDFQSPADVGWYGSAYLLASCAFQPIFGQLYRQFEVRTIFLGSLALFMIGSLICALAPTSSALIVGRAVAGVSCAGVVSGDLNLMARSAPLEKRPKYIAWIGGMYGVGLACGPLIGGAFTSKVSWEWCFWINLPVGAVVFAVVILCYRAVSTSSPEKTVLQRLIHLDWVGGVLVLTAVVMLLLALEWGGVEYAWSNSRIIGLLVGSGVEMLVFIGWCWYRGNEALVPLHILRNRTVACTMVAGFFQSGASFLPIFYLPYWFQVVQGATSLQSGVDLIPWMVANFVAAIAGGLIVSKTGYCNPLLLLGPSIGAIGAGLLVTLHPGISVGMWVGYQILNGAGLGLARQQYLVAPQIVLTPAEIPFAMAFVLFAQNLAGSVFVSVGNALIRNSLRSTFSEQPGFFQAGSNLTTDAILNAGPTQVRGLIPAQELDAFTGFYNTALRDVWICAVPLAVLAALAALPIKWVNLKAKRAQAAQATKPKA